MSYDYELEPDVINDAQSCIDISIDARDGIYVFGHVYHYGAWAWAYADAGLARKPALAEMSASLRAGPASADYERRMRHLLMRLYHAVEDSHLTLNPDEIIAIVTGIFPEIEKGTLSKQGLDTLRVSW